MPGPYLVRKAAGLTSSETVTGDGPGTENPVPVRGMNQVVLLVDFDQEGDGTSGLDVYMETSINGTDYYRDTDLSDVTDGTVTVHPRTFEFAETDWADTSAHRATIGIDVLSAFARFTFLVNGSDDFDNVACRAITGRV